MDSCSGEEYGTARIHRKRGRGGKGFRQRSEAEREIIDGEEFYPLTDSYFSCGLLCSFLLVRIHVRERIRKEGARGCHRRPPPRQCQPGSAARSLNFVFSFPSRLSNKRQGKKHNGESKQKYFLGDQANP
ncbi:hypothetical protein H6P81_005401 [Aristolochia fimbriata]|uniref:Uncharacterized protein n=1 Tax=Aristolochia fimbriata TaxID=158543 RepID=A0AAV7EUH0_ARIFI|nr:hypothetical protein H6P81_005401 [Aristolochia fimbriata]